VTFAPKAFAVAGRREETGKGSENRVLLQPVEETLQLAELWAIGCSE
jgi:hypothetical protein